MRSELFTLVSMVGLAHSAAIHQRAPAGGAQSIPNTPPAQFFHAGVKQLVGEPPEDTTTPVPDVYSARDIDLPFYRLFHGNMKFFSAGQLNTPDKDTDAWVDAGGVDNANQSACGIPDNAFSVSKVAIHPYFLKYADLSRFCEQDVCISFWKEDGSSDMILKVTDICSTDENDPTHCTTPMDIKLDRSKAEVMEHLTTPPTGDEYPEQVWWFFTKCWADALAQPAYDNNWFTTPALPNNLHWSQTTASEQYKNNQEAYPAKGWPTYANGGYNTTRVAEPLGDWVKGDEPCYEPIAGGKGWGNKICGQGQSSSSPASASNDTVPATPSSSVVPLASSASAVQSAGSSPEPASSSVASFPSSPPATVNAVKPEEKVEDAEQDECEL